MHQLNLKQHNIEHSAIASCVATTLLELLLYFTLLSIFLLAAMTFSIEILKANRASAFRNELHTNTQFILQNLMSTISEAKSVDVINSVLDNDNGTLALTMSDAAISPLKFLLSQGKVMRTPANASGTALSSNDITCTQLRFHRIVVSKSPDQIVIDMSCKSVSTLANLQQVFPIHLSVSLRNYD